MITPYETANLWLKPTNTRDLMIYFVDGFTDSLSRTRPDVYVSGNNFVYYEEGDPKKRVSPDCYVVFGVPQTHARLVT